MPKGTLLLIDDENSLRQVLTRVLELEGYTVLAAATAYGGLELLAQHAGEVLVILSDVKLPDGHGLALLPRYKQAAPLAEIVLMTAFGTIADGVQAMKLGAFDYLTKGNSDDQLVVVVERAADKARLQQRVAALEKKVEAQFGFEAMIGHSGPLTQAKALALRVAPTDSTVLLEGPTGSGKELFAQAIHQASPRRAKPFVAVNCSAFPRDLLESELFGYRKGAFTGAGADKRGLIEEASGGTLFLDEIGELPLALQAKLLRVLESRQYLKVGDTKPLTANVRIVAATNRNLRQEAEEGNFREDLYYRLAVFTVSVPGLNVRREDIEPLARYFVQLYAGKLRKRLRGMEPDVLRHLTHYNWRGNVRELKNVLERAVILADHDLLTVADLPAELHYVAEAPAGSAGSGSTASTADWTLRTAELHHIRQVLGKAHGNKAEAARMLGVAVTTLYRKMQEYGLPG